LVSVTSENKAGEARDAGSGKSLEIALQRLKPGVSDHLAGEKDMVKSELQPYLPMELIGGSVPYVPGTEEEAVWNAAAQACATEKVHFAYSVEGKRVWYLACPSSSLASNPDSWCPLAAALPGQSEFWDKETVYLYEQEGVASALRWDAETGRMQVYLGAARTILPRIQSMDANFVTVNPEVAKVVPWKNRALFSEKLARATSRVLLLSGLGVSFMAIIILVFQYLSVNMMRRDLSQVKQETREASSKLMVDAARSMQSDIFKHMVRIQELLDGLRKIDGTLVRYEVDKNRVQWEALVPPAFGQAKADGRGGVGVVRGEVVPGIEEDGRVRIRGTR
jgi:hypothetical protein